MTPPPGQVGWCDRVVDNEFKLMVTLLFTSVGRAMGWLRKRVQQRAVSSPVMMAEPQVLAAGQALRRSNQMPASAVPFVAVAKEVYPELGISIEHETTQVGTSRRAAGRSAICSGVRRESRGAGTEVLAQPSARVNRPFAGQARRALLAPRTSLKPRKSVDQASRSAATPESAPKSSTIPVDPIFGVWPRRPLHPWN